MRHSLPSLYDVFLHSFNASAVAGRATLLQLSDDDMSKRDSMCVPVLCCVHYQHSIVTSTSNCIWSAVSIPLALPKQSISIIRGITRRCFSLSTQAWWIGRWAAAQAPSGVGAGILLLHDWNDWKFINKWCSCFVKRTSATHDRREKLPVLLSNQWTSRNA